MRRALAVPAGLGLLLLAFGVAYSTPGAPQVEAPFVVTGGVGDQIVSQHLVATVNDVALAEVVELNSWTGTTSGVWLVVDATVEARIERTGVEANLFIAGVRYPGTNRTSTDTVDGRVADAGFPVTGAILIELPADVQTMPGAAAAVLRLSPGIDARLDSVIELTLDLTPLDVAGRVELATPRDGAR
ncbi:hypothetical protein [Pseudolysinimonas yzui]|uniref:DUF4382 domain-containing protein n=1 Tax=Pseudolysinimonas yzui TaxID=2708254 RepID=A0A8J3GT26_9MICO|nr:hypothetical protein [Pseudolysinimonas yzui]GHF26035.1 hypothetical protein GCM10011600_28720 [Pseudolysinimonas yzui]